MDQGGPGNCGDGNADDNSKTDYEAVTDNKVLAWVGREIEPDSSDGFPKHSRCRESATGQTGRQGGGGDGTQRKAWTSKDSPQPFAAKATPEGICKRSCEDRQAIERAGAWELASFDQNPPVLQLGVPPGVPRPTIPLRYDRSGEGDQPAA